MKQRRKLTQEEAFALWWAKRGPNPAFVDIRKDNAMALIHDWAKAAFANGAAFGRRRAKE